MAMIDDFARQRDATRQRLFWMVLGFCLLASIVLIRLAYLQVLRADSYREQLDNWLVLRPDYLPPLRGDIHDRRDSILAQDVPGWQVEADYGILDAMPLPSGRNSYVSRYVARLARRLRRAGQMPTDVPMDVTQEAIHQRIAESWQKLADLTGTPTWRMYQTADAIVERIRAARERYEERTGIADDIEAQHEFHPILKDLSSEVANKLRLELAGYPWLRVHTSTTRQYVDDRAICHLIGRLRDVSPEDLDPRTTKDPYPEDELRGLLAGEQVGGSGIEYIAEQRLRGVRGKIVCNRAGDRLVDIAPVRGQDVHLTIDMVLQRWIYDRLAQSVHATPTASGAAAVVLDVNTREVLAAVSWPGYTLEDYSHHYDKLARDGVHQPLRCRAVSNSYAPGSIVKPVTLLAAFNNRLVGMDERVNCTGFLDPNNHKSFRCWTESRGMTGGHGPLDAQEAIMHSCDIFFYVMGRRLGVQREAEWFSLFGLGRAAGTDLLEEANGKVPLASDYKPFEQQGASQNLAIGQGELLLTPLQAANLAATVATGAWQPVTLLAEQADARRAARQVLPGSAAFWRIVREGMFDVVNAPSGTAYKYARSEGVQIAGKTGTAETGPRVTSYIYDLKMHDGSTQTLEFPSKVQATDTITQMGESVVKWDLKGARYWPAPPDPEHKPTHAWFMGFAPAHKPQIAVAVQIEYGGGGSHIAGPVARDILEYVFGVEGNHKDTEAGPAE
jgi:penicillin-binding protein 2